MLAEPTYGQLRVVSWNVAYRVGPAAVLQGEWLAALRPVPDIVLLQEVNPNSGGPEPNRINSSRWYREPVDDAAPILTFEELADAVRSAPSPTADDVSITWDGQRLDSKEKVLRFLAELDVARKDGLPVGPPLS